MKLGVSFSRQLVLYTSIDLNPKFQIFAKVKIGGSQPDGFADQIDANSDVNFEDAN